jgi:hypothetical protein
MLPSIKGNSSLSELLFWDGGLDSDHHSEVAAVACILQYTYVVVSPPTLGKIQGLSRSSRGATHVQRIEKTLEP